MGRVVSLGVFAILLLASHAAAQTFTFEFAGDVQTLVVPPGVTLLRVDARGAEGGQGDAGALGLGGKGGRVETTIAVTPGETLSLFVGGAGGNSGGSGAPGPGGFNGGGDGGQGVSFFSPTGAFFGGGGGGASDIRRGGTSLADRIVVAGAGGGGGIGQCVCPGGAGGGTTAADGGDAPAGEGGGGGSQTAGGAGGASTSGGTAGTDGALGTGGQGGGGSPNGRGGGGGGGGYFGGGGGGGGGDGTATVAFPGAGGGGGSSFSSGTDTIHTPGFQAGNWLIILTTVVSRTVAIDIKPGSFPNSINPKSRGKIPVAILSSGNFDAPSEVDPTSLTFGRTGDEVSLAFCSPSPEDVNLDGFLDLVCHFDAPATGFQAGDTHGILKGQTRGGTPLAGTDTVRIVSK